MLITGISEKATLELLLQALLTNQKQLAEQISEVRAKLGDKEVPNSTTTAKPAPNGQKTPAKAAAKPLARPKMSEEGRQRIIEAQKARWAKIRRDNKAKSKAKKPAKTPGQRLNLAHDATAAAS